MSMTWRHLAEKIKKMSDEQKDTDVTIHDVNIDEYFSIKHLLFANEEENDVLDDKHPYLEFE